MYQFKMKIKNRNNNSESVSKSNNIQTLINEIKQYTNVTFVIMRTRNSQLILKGVK